MNPGEGRHLNIEPRETMTSVVDPNADITAIVRYD